MFKISKEEDISIIWLLIFYGHIIEQKKTIFGTY
jgi:hypothetical protein